MTKYLKLFVLLPLLLLAGQAGANPHVVAVSGPSGGRALSCSESFSVGGDTNDVDGNSMFDSENPNDDADLIIKDDAGAQGDFLRHIYDDTSEPYVEESSCLDNEAEVTIKGKIRFSVKAALSDGQHSYDIFYGLDNAAAVLQTSLRLWTNAVTFELKYVVANINGDTGTSLDISGIAVNTWYDFVYHYLKSASGGASFQLVGIGTSTTNYDSDNSAHLGLGRMRIFGGGAGNWQNGNATNIDLDDLEIYHYDAR